MKNETKLLFITALLSSLLFSGVTLFAQDSTTETEEEDWDWSWEVEEFEQWIHFGRKMPTVSLLYGITEVSNESMTEPLSDANLLELQLGHTTAKRQADTLRIS